MLLSIEDEETLEVWGLVDHLWYYSEGKLFAGKTKYLFSPTAVNVAWMLVPSLLVYCNALLYVCDIIHIYSVVSYELCHSQIGKATMLSFVQNINN